jgi:hypothetical protein
MKILLAVGFATLYGLALRMMFGVAGELTQIMSVSFLVLAPLVIGFLTVYLVKSVKSYSGAFFTPWLTCLGILVITVILNVEGTICWMMIFPLFAVAAGIGGVFALFLRKRSSDESKNAQGPFTNKWSLPFILVLPAAAGVAEGDRILNRLDFTISESVVIQASPEIVWHELTNINTIPQNEQSFSFSEMMGFPAHVSTTLDTLAVGGKRLAIYEHGLYFNETIAQFEEGKRMVLNIHTDPTKIPPTVMDEHILIGGKHVDIEQDIYTIEKLSDSSCRLTLSSRFWINTPFNWYTAIWAKYLMSDILSGEIELIKERAENNTSESGARLNTMETVKTYRGIYNH